MKVVCKIFTLIVVALIATGVGLFIKSQFFRNDAGASAQTTCAVIQAEQLTKPVLVGGIANSGQLDFGKADSDLKACVYKNGADYLVEGSVWNTNLGWMSFNGTGYNVSVSADGTMAGQAYGDNIGYIQMDSVRIAMNDNEDGGDCGTMKKGDLYGRAWTDTVGWLDFCGAHVDLSVLEEPEPATEPAPEPTPVSGGTSDTLASVPGQAAMIQGDFHADLFTTEGLAVKVFDEDGNEIDEKVGMTIGENTNLTRETLYRNIAKNLRENDGVKIDKKTLTSFEPTKVTEMKQVGLTNDIYSYIVYYQRDKNKTNNKPCSVVLDGPSDLTKNLEIDTKQSPSSRQITIVAEGCDIFIDRNIRTNHEDSTLGIIALEDLSIEGGRKGGNVYVCSRVTDIEANLFMDGSLFSYGQEEDKCGDDKSALIDQTTGYPDFGTLPDEEIRNLFRHQLAIFGSVISNNTYGGSVSGATPPEYALGDGTITENKNTARLFDINFLRYSKVDKTKGDKPTDLCWDKSVRLSKYLIQSLFPDPIKHYWTYPDTALVAKYWDEICTENNPNELSIVNIRYGGAFSEYLPIFNNK